MTESHTEVADMPKVQKTFYLDADVAALIDKVTEISGAAFTKVMAAALLQYIFETAHTPENGRIVGPVAPEWMSYASRLDRGDITVGRIPLDALKNAVFWAKRQLARRDQTWNAHWKKTLKIREEALRDFQTKIEEGKDDLSVILPMIEECFDIRR